MAPARGERRVPAAVTPFTILYQDDFVVAIDKPPGILVHRSAESRDRVFVLQTLAAQIERFLYPVHRLDRATSGVLLFALSSEAARELQAALSSEDSEKEYLVFARGSTEPKFTVDRPLTDRDAPGRPKREARTEFVRLAEFHRSSLLRATLRTGRRHQIRRHLQNLGHNVIGDTTYGKGKINRSLREEYGLPRLCLHATRLAFDHPKRGSLEIGSRLPDDLRTFFLALPEAPTELIQGL